MNGWSWRKASGGWTLRTDPGDDARHFHAYDAKDLAACEPHAGLSQSCEEPNEGSSFCPACMDVVRFGRPLEVSDG